MKYKAFISYRHSENGRRHAVALETALKRYAKPTLARPMKIFRDEKHMKPDISLPKLIQDGLENSEYLIFLAEKDAASSVWCQQELEEWCNPEKLNRTDRLIIALIDDEIVLRGIDGIHWEQTNALPNALQPYLSSIPLYMDLRWAKSATDTDLIHPKYRHEINSLTARLKGVNPEDLNDEEIRVYRRNIRLRNGAIGVLLTMLLISMGATWWAISQQKIAERERVIAEQERKNAETQLLVAKLAASHKLPENFDPLMALDSLSCTSWDLSALPPQIGKLQNLKSLDLSSNKLTALPIEIATLHNLQSLNLYYNQLSSLPDELAQLQNLRSINLGYNKWSSFPHQVLKLLKLESLNLGYAGLNSLPSEIGKLQNLQSLNLVGNQLSSLPSEIGNLQNMHSLSLSGNQMKILPKEILLLKNMQSLDLGGNQLGELTAEIGTFQQLQFLTLNAMGLESLPAQIGELQNLRSLNLSQNMLKTLPAEIAKLKNLQYLDLTGNQFIDSPSEIKKLQNLPKLDTLILFTNFYTASKVPIEIGLLQNLKYLDLRYNQLKTLPATIRELQKLEYLDLSGNLLSTLPINDLRQMPNLKKLVLWQPYYQNPMKKNEVEALRKVMPWCEIVWQE